MSWNRLGWVGVLLAVLVVGRGSISSAGGIGCRSGVAVSARVHIATIGGVPVIVDGRGRARVLATVAVPVAYPLGGYSAVVSGFVPADAEVRAQGRSSGEEDALANEAAWEGVLRRRCARCHTAGDGAEGVTLFESGSVTPAEGFSDASVLYQVVTDGMPKGGVLSVEEKAVLVAWLRERASKGE